MQDSQNHLKNEILNQLDLINESDNNDDINLTGEKALWQSVIMQAVIDIMNNSKRTSEKVEKSKAIAWFSINNVNFLWVCEMAELDPKFVIRNASILIKKHAKTNNNNLKSRSTKDLDDNSYNQKILNNNSNKV